MKQKFSLICAIFTFIVALVFFTAALLAVSAQLPADVESIKAEYEKTFAKILEERGKEIELATAQYLKQLKATLDRCMDERKLDEAIAIRQEMDRVRSAAPATEEGLREGLVLHFDFDKAEADKKVLDTSGQGNHGQVIGAHWTPKGKKGGAFEFRSEGNQIRVPNKPSLNPKRITLTAWIKTDYTDAKYRRIFDKSCDKGIAMSIAGMPRNNSKANQGKLLLEIGPSFWNVSDTVITDGEWHHVTGTYDGNFQRLYVDGQIQKMVPRWNGIVLPNDFGLVIGSNGSTPKEEVDVSFRGVIDEPMVFSRALSMKEIQLLYELQK